jgi:hypothetical protein
MSSYITFVKMILGSEVNDNDEVGGTGTDVGE